MRTGSLRELHRRHLSYVLHCTLRYYSRVSPPPPAHAEPVLRVINNVAQFGSPKEGPKPRQLLSLPPFPDHPLPGRCLIKYQSQHESSRVTAIGWVKYYLDEVDNSVIQSHFTKGLVKMDYRCSDDSSVVDLNSMKKDLGGGIWETLLMRFSEIETKMVNILWRALQIRVPCLPT